MADPIAKAATLWAEERFAQGARLSGLGGEVARGFYYTGVVRDTPVTRARTARLARWRMFANEAVQKAALDQAFVAEAQPVSLGIVHRALTETGLEWYRGHRRPLPEPPHAALGRAQRVGGVLRPADRQPDARRSVPGHRPGSGAAGQGTRTVPGPSPGRRWIPNWPRSRWTTGLLRPYWLGQAWWAG